MGRLPKGCIPTDGHGRDAWPRLEGQRKHRCKDDDDEIAANPLPTARKRFIARMTKEQRRRWHKTRYHLRKVNPQRVTLTNMLKKTTGATRTASARNILEPGTMVRASFEIYNKKGVTEPTPIIKCSVMNCPEKQRTSHMYTVKVKWLAKNNKPKEREIAVPASQVTPVD